VKEQEKSTESLQMQPEEEIQAKSSEGEPQEKEEQNQELVQTKLTVGAPGDKYEQEADSMAAKVMTMPDSALRQRIQRQTEEDTEAVQMQPLVNSITPVVQRSSGEEEEVQMKSEVQRASDGSSVASGNVENQLAGSKGGGSPLPNDVRSYMEPRFGADFSSVRVHTDSNAVQMNKELGAQAFAHGSDIYYGAGKYPGNNELTAHELTHTIQQTGAKQLSAKSSVNLKSDKETFQTNSNAAIEERSVQPKIARAGLNWGNITVEAPSRLGASSTYSGRIQRQPAPDGEEQQGSAEPLKTQSEDEIQSLRRSELEQQGEAYKNKLNESIFNDVTKTVKLYGGPIKKDVTAEYQKENYKEEFRSKPNGKVVIVTFEVPQDQTDPQWPKIRASLSSADQKIKTFKSMSLKPVLKQFPLDVEVKDFAQYITEQNNDDEVCGIIVQMPAPSRLMQVVAGIDPKKDLDALSPSNERQYKFPATSEGIVRLVEPFAQSGQTVAVVGGGGFVGGGVVSLLTEKGIQADVFEYGDNLININNYDIVVSTVGIPGVVKSEYLKKEHILVVDTGFIPRTEKEGTLDVVGDVEKSAQEIPKHITPVPGGTGPVEMAVLMERIATVLGVQVRPWRVELQDGKLRAVFDG
jgi:5,10-methylene-tetrahydrofolate dehydrogenase/methenyl tetrahydrofolate cyclohydrolase